MQAQRLSTADTKQSASAKIITLRKGFFIVFLLKDCWVLRGFFALIFHCFIVFQNRRYNTAIHICAIIAGSSAAGTLLTMYTDNVINYTMATLSYPCGFYGMMLGLIVGYKQK